MGIFREGIDPTAETLLTRAMDSDPKNHPANDVLALICNFIGLISAIICFSLVFNAVPV
jgi:hypothetical protein